MKNSYMFFDKQLFENFEHSQFSKKDISIPNTNVHIYEFEYIGEELSEELIAAKLDELSNRISNEYEDTFQVVNSESSQCFCAKLYPLVVDFETKLRYSLYVSRSLYENGNVTKESFLYDVGKEKKSIEEIDFGEIYEHIFTDRNLKGELMKKYSSNLTKADLVSIINDLEENTLWHNVVGDSYNYIENNFLRIKNYRNTVMHNHLISYEKYKEAKTLLESAVAELDRAIADKLITNKSTYLNKVNIVESLSGIFKAMGLFAIALEKAQHPDKYTGMLDLLVNLFATTKDINGESDKLLGEELELNDSGEDSDESKDNEMDESSTD